MEISSVCSRLTGLKYTNYIPHKGVRQHPHQKQKGCPWYDRWRDSSSEDQESVEYLFYLAQSAGAVEYTNCFFAEE